MAKILIVEDDVPLARSYGQLLARENYTIETVYDGQTALQNLETFKPDILLLDLNLPDVSGIDVLEQMGSSEVAPETIVITGEGSISRAVETVRCGAVEFLVKPVTGEKLRTSIQTHLARKRKQHKKQQDTAGSEEQLTCGMIGQAAIMQPLFSILRNAAPTEASVFITGESGTGKELCAEAIHRMSKRAAGPLVPLNCAAIPRDLLESEIFGHKAGAFTGATQDRQGAAMRAHNGTLFLDEICEMDLSLQAKLLRFLQTQKVDRLGDDKSHDVDVRVICATNRDPRSEITKGNFREDLYYRLHVVPIMVPALRERGHDILLLAQSFLKRFSEQENRSFTGFSMDAQRAMLDSDWPGNIRQLQNVVRNIVIMNNSSTVEDWMLPPEIRKVLTQHPPHQAQLEDDQPLRRASLGAQELSRPITSPVMIGEINKIEPLERVIEQKIEAAIQHFGGNVTKAAAALEISPSTIYRRIDPRRTGNKSHHAA